MISRCVALIFFVIGGLISLNSHSKGIWDYSLDLWVTRCFKSKQVHAKCNSDIIDEEGTVSAELEITAEDANGQKFLYGYGKSIEGGLCREHFRKIKRLMRKVDQVCITGVGEGRLEGEIYARWQGLETKNGKYIW